MCEPVTIGTLALTAGQTFLAGLTIASTAASVYAGNKQAQAQADAINAQNRVQAEQISRQAAQQMSENAKRAYIERGAMRAAAAESGINLGSNSFLAALQTSAMNQYNEAGTIVYNERASQDARQARARSLGAQLTKDTALSAALKIGGTAANSFLSMATKVPSTKPTPA